MISRWSFLCSPCLSLPQLGLRAVQSLHYILAYIHFLYTRACDQADLCNHVTTCGRQDCALSAVSPVGPCRGWFLTLLSLWIVHRFCQSSEQNKDIIIIIINETLRSHLNRRRTTETAIWATSCVTQKHVFTNLSVWSAPATTSEAQSVNSTQG